MFLKLLPTVLQTMAAIIASQALITGAFSIVQQVLRLCGPRTGGGGEATCVCGERFARHAPRHVAPIAQAISLNCFPRLTIRHTSKTSAGQVGRRSSSRRLCAAAAAAPPLHLLSCDSCLHPADLHPGGQLGAHALRRGNCGNLPRRGQDRQRL